ncbi:hypothetical protein EJ110_NYTH15873 [Nymphaea thermarum]|nr:hypothetical protein EJ110_NYTH15873 [Nymphaea thermarum]
MKNVGVADEEIVDPKKYLEESCKPNYHQHHNLPVITAIFVITNARSSHDFATNVTIFAPTLTTTSTTIAMSHRYGYGCRCGYEY